MGKKQIFTPMGALQKSCFRLCNTVLNKNSPEFRIETHLMVSMIVSTFLYKNSPDGEHRFKLKLA
jgi:hypothetical protein